MGKCSLSTGRAEDPLTFLRLAYDTTAEAFAVTAAILRLATKYAVDALREVTLRHLALSWPTTLQMWEVREKAATGPGDVYAPQPVMPHPLYVRYGASAVACY